MLGHKKCEVQLLLGSKLFLLKWVQKKVYNLHLMVVKGRDKSMINYYMVTVHTPQSLFLGYEHSLTSII